MKCSSLFSTLTLLNANAQRELIIVIAEITNTSVSLEKKAVATKGRQFTQN